MIPKIAPRGGRVGGLLRYLYGPGKHEEHRDPHLVAAWSGAGALSRLEPEVGPSGQRDFRRLVDLLEQPVRAGRNPPKKPVWHCSVRLHPTDRLLTDAQWAHVAGEVLAQAGLAPNGDDRSVRWVAMRHGADHIHIVATLVRQDRRTEWGRNDRWRVQAACRDLEERYGLYRVGPTDRTAHRRPCSAEVNKALRTERPEIARDQLRREVRFAAAAAGSEAEFFDLLRDAGVQVKQRRSSTSPGQITGYSVALADHSAADGTPIFYGGGRLAPDLSLGRLRERWRTPRRSAQPAGTAGWRRVLGEASAQVGAAAEDVRQWRNGDPDPAVATGSAAADTLTVVARLVEGDRRGRLHQAAEELDRATRAPYGRRPPRSEQAEALRSVSRLLWLTGRRGDNTALYTMLRLIINLSLFADALADLHEAQQRLHQSRAARTAARLLQAAGRTEAGATPAMAGVTPPTTVPPTPHRDHRGRGSAASPGRNR